MADTSKKFMEYVQDHERNWGNRTYRGRPDLIHIMQAKVVVFWEVMQNDDDKPLNRRRANLTENTEITYVMTLHDDLDEIAEYLIKQVFRSQYSNSNRRIARIYRNQNLVRIKDVKITFEEEDSE